MSTFLKKLPSKLGRIYKKISINTNGNLFCLLFNISATLRGVDVRFTVKDNSYVASSKKYRRYFYSKSQNWSSYTHGIAQRGEDLGKDYFCHLIDFKPNDLIVDCGANVGDLNLYFEEKNIQIRYVGIEPSPKEYECLQKNCPDGKNLNIGLWSEDSSLSFFVSSKNADSSFIQPKKYTDTISISTRRLDLILNEPIKLLKIEAEGAEPEALLGCSNLLNSIEYISADLGFERGVKQESTLVPVTNFLLQNDFELIAINYPRIVALFKRKKVY